MQKPVAGTHPARKAEGVLLLITVLWGSSFVVAHFALEAGLTPLFVLLCRFFIAFLFVGVLYAKRIAQNFRFAQLKFGVALGAVFLAAFYTQLLGLQYSTPSNNAIITSANVVIVPFIVWMVRKKRPRYSVFLSCAISLAGILVISLNVSQGFALHFGDALSLLSAALFAVQIVAVGQLSHHIDFSVLVCMEFGTAALLSLALFGATGGRFSLFFNTRGMLAVLYLGAVCTCVCFLLQAWALRRVQPARGAVIMSTEALFGALLSMLLGVERLSWRVVVGGLLLFFAVVLPELTALPGKTGNTAQ